MCNHHFEVEHRPVGDNRGDGWELLESVHMSDATGGIGEWLIARGRQQALRIAEIYALAEPERAHEIVIQRYSCNGPEDEAERPFAEGELPEVDPQKLARHVVALRQALRDLSRIEVKRSNGRLHLSMPEDAGRIAERALRAGWEEEGS